MGIIAGAIKGHTTEAGFLDGACKGAVTGAIAALELLNFAAADEPLSKVIIQIPWFGNRRDSYIHIISLMDSS